MESRWFASIRSHNKFAPTNDVNPNHVIGFLAIPKKSRHSAIILPSHFKDCCSVLFRIELELTTRAAHATFHRKFFAMAVFRE